jgi:tripartite-type tricarboxylate transporter receptor subunit TctC
MTSSRLLPSIFSIAAIICMHGGYAQVYPNKPIRIVTTAVGGGSDFVARQVGPGISGPLGQPVIIENRPGTFVAEETVAKASPDGHSLLINASGVWIEPLLHKAPYDPVRELSPITLTSKTPLLLVVYPSLPVNSVKDLIAHTKAKPGATNYALQSIGGANHLAGELFMAMAGVKLTGVPYKGTPQALTDLMSGQVHLMFANSIASLPHVKSGRLKALAITSLQPSGVAPEVPTVAASGLPGYEIAAIFSVFAPASTATPIINRLYQEIARVLKTPDVKERFLNTGSDVVAGSPAELAAYIKSDIAKWGKLIKDANIRVE